MSSTHNVQNAPWMLGTPTADCSIVRFTSVCSAVELRSPCQNDCSTKVPRTATQYAGKSRENRDATKSSIRRP